MRLTAKTRPMRTPKTKIDPPEDQRKSPVAEVGGAVITAGTLVKTAGERGVFRFLYRWLPDGSLACWDDRRHRMRSFRPETVSVPKRTKKS